MTRWTTKGIGVYTRKSARLVSRRNESSIPPADDGGNTPRSGRNLSGKLNQPATVAFDNGTKRRCVRANAIFVAGAMLRSRNQVATGMHHE